MCRTLGFCLWWMVPLNFLLSAFRAGHAPQAYFSDAGKVGKSAPGRPRPPFVCPIGRLQGRYRVATEFPLGRWPLVIGAVLHELRLTALGMMGVSCHVKIDGSTPSKGRQPKLDAQPAADQMPGGFVSFSGYAGSNLIQAD